MDLTGFTDGARSQVVETAGIRPFDQPPIGAVRHMDDTGLNG
jgi:hypothetical protein